MFSSECQFSKWVDFLSSHFHILHLFYLYIFNQFNASITFHVSQCNFWSFPILWFDKWYIHEFNIVYQTCFDAILRFLFPSIFHNVYDQLSQFLKFSWTWLQICVILTTSWAETHMPGILFYSCYLFQREHKFSFVEIKYLNDTTLSFSFFFSIYFELPRMRYAIATLFCRICVY